MLFLFSKFKTAIEKAVNEDDAETNVQSSARSSGVLRHKGLSGRAASLKQSTVCRALFLLLSE